MSQVCELTGKRPSYGNKVSHSNIKTRTRWMPNLKTKKFEIPELKLTYALLLSTRALRTIDKFGGITPALMNAKDEVLSDRLAKVKRAIQRARVKASAQGNTTEGKAAKAAKAVHTEKTVKVAKPANKAPAKPAKKVAKKKA